MKIPKSSYRIWHANRSGSTLLCQLLEDTKIAGRPNEHFTLHGESSLCEKFKVSEYRSLIDKIWTIGTSENGVFADKATAHYQAHKDTIQELSSLKGVSMPTNYESIWQEIFPHCKHIVIVRTNKVRQAVSWWKAIRDSQWHIQGDEKVLKSEDFYKDKYNKDALKHLYSEAVLRDIANQEYLAKHDLDYITVTYEDLENDPLRIVRQIMEYIGLPPVKSLPKMRFRKIANSVNERWVHQFKEDLQEGMDTKAWI